MKILFKCTKIRALLTVLMVFFLSVSWGQTTWVKVTDYASLNSNDTYLIVDITSSSALTSAQGTGTAPSAASIVLQNSTTITGNINDQIQWKFQAVNGGGYYIYQKDNVDKKLYSTNTNNGVRVGTATSNAVWNLGHTSGNYKGFVNKAYTRYLGVYDDSDWRTYTTVHSNISSTKIEIFKLEEQTSPTLVVPASLTGFTYTENNGPSAVQTLEVSGTELDGSDVTITASADYEVSLDGVDFINTVVLTSFDGTATTVHTRLKSGLSIGLYSGNLTFSGGGVTPNPQVDLTGQVTMNVPVITTETINGIFNEELSYTIIASNDPTAYQLVSGTLLPDGLTLDSTTGVISGTPENAGVFTADIIAENAGGNSLPATYTFSIAKAAQTLLLPDVVKTLSSVPFDLPLTTNEGFLLEYTSANPDIATVSDHTVTITGLGTVVITATQQGNANYNPFTHSFSLEVSTTPIPLPEVTESVQTGTYNEPFTYTLQATNDAVSYAIEAGSSLPNGLTLNETTGVISGVLAQSGTLTTQVTATNETGTSAPATITFEISKANQSVTLDAISKTTQDLPFDLTVVSTDQGLPLTYTIADPDVATISGTTITITGAGSTSITASQAGNENYLSLSQNFDLTVVWVIPPPVVVSEATNGMVDSAFSYTINALNTPVSYALASGEELPAGLLLNSSTGIITGLPTTAGTFTTAVTATNETGTSAASTITFVIEKGVQTAVLTDINKNTNDLPFDLTGKTDKGLDLIYTVADPTVATISGTTVTIVGEGTTLITAVEAGTNNYQSFTQDITLTVVWQLPVPVITVEEVSATAGIAFSYTINASNEPLSYSLVSGNSLPAGLSLNTTTGEISGTTIAPGTYNVNIRATNSTGASLPATITFVIAPGTVVADGCFNENFSEITVGSNTTTSGQSTGWTGNLNFPYIETVYQAGGAIKLGSGSVKGSVTSAALNGISGTVTVTFDVKGWTSIEGTMLVTLGDETKTVPYTARLSNDFETKTIVFENVTDGSVIKFETSSKRAFLDNISVCNFVPDPIIVFSETSLTGFTYTENNGPSAVQTLEVSGTELDGSDVTITASADYEVSLDGVDFINTVVLTSFDGTATTVHTRLKSGLSIGLYSGNLTFSGGGVTPNPQVDLTGQVTMNVPVITTETINGIFNEELSYTIIASNDPTAYQLVSGTQLPDGLTLDSTTGVISGTPENAGVFTADIIAENAGGNSLPATYTFSIAKAAQTLLLPDVVKTLSSVPFDLPLTTNEGFLLEYTSANPDIATVSDHTVTITGLGTVVITATQQGNANYNPFTHSFSLEVSTTPIPLPEVTESVQTGTYNEPFTYTLQATNDAVSYAIEAGSSLPNGLTLNETTGVISGVLAQSGTLTTQVTATNETGTSAPATITFEISKANQSVTLDAISKTTQDLPFDLTVVSTDQGLPLTYTIADPDVATISGTTITITGAGSTSITASQAGNENYLSLSQNFDLTVVWVIPPPVVVSEATNGMVDSAFSYTINALNTPVSYALASGEELPAGLLLNSSTGIITGLPTTAGTFTTAVTATNETGTSAASTITFVIEKGVQTAVLTDINKNTNDLPFDLTGKTDKGLDLIYTVADPTVATISGTTVTIVGEGTTLITAVEAGTNNYQSFTQDITLTVVWQLPVPVITVEEVSATAGIAFSYTINASNEPLSYSLVSGNSLPAGLSLNTTTGEISGTTIAPGTYNVNVRATNSTGASLPATITFVIAPGTVVADGCFNENFSEITVGSNTTTSGQSTGWTGNLNFPYIETVYQAGGAIKLGSGSVKGSVTSAALNGISGTVTVTFDVKGWTSIEGTMLVTLGDETKTVPYTARLSNDFETKTIVFENVTDGSVIKFETSSKRAFLDNISVCNFVPDPIIVSSETSLTGFTYTENNGPSAVQTLEVSGTELDGSDVTITASSDYEVSTDGTTFTDMVGLVTYDGTATTLHVRLKNGLPATAYSGSLTINGGGISTAVEVALSGTVTEEIIILNPEIVVSSASLTGFDYVEYNGPSAVQALEVSGTELDGSDVLITASSDYEVSTDGTTFTDMVGLVTYDGTVTTLHIRLKSGLPATAYSGSLTINGGGISTVVEVALSGTVTEEIIILNPEIVVSSALLTGFDYVENNGPSAVQTLEVSGTELDGSDVLITASSDYEVSTDGTTFTDMVGLVTYDGTTTTLYVRLKSGLPVTAYSGSLTINGGGISTVVEVALSGTVTEEIIIFNPEIVVSSALLTGFDYVENNGPSAVQTLEVSGTELDGSDVLITASSDYEVSTDGTTFTDMVGLVTYEGTATTLHVRLKSGLPATAYSGSLTINGGGISTAVEVALSGTVTEEIIILNPEIVVSSALLTGFDYVENNGPSAVQTLEVSGTELDGSDVLITASSDYEVSTDGTTFTDMVGLVTYEGTATTLHVRLKSGLPATAYSGSLTINGGGISTAVEVALSGTVTEEIIILNPEIVVSSASLTGFDYVENNGPSAVQTLEVSGTELDGSDVLITASSDYEVSTDGTTFTDMVGLVTYDGMTTTLHVRLKSGLPATAYNGSLTINGGGISTAVEVALSGTVTEEIIILNPEIVVSSALLTGFDYVENNGPSAVQTLEVSGTELDGSDVLITASSDYEVSTDGTTFTDMVGLVTYDGTVTTLHVRLKSGLPATAYTGSLAINGGGISTVVEVALSGTVTEVVTPIIIASVATVTELDYIINQGPSQSKIIEISATDLNDTSVTIVASGSFEISLNNEAFTTSLVLADLITSSQTVYVRLIAGLVENTYDGILTISGGGAPTVSISLNGIVSPTATNPDFEKDTFTMYPNPATDVVMFNKNVDVEIYTVNGKRIISQRNTSRVDVSHLEAGVYLVKTSNGYIQKLIIK